MPQDRSAPVQRRLGRGDIALAAKVLWAMLNWNGRRAGALKDFGWIQGIWNDAGHRLCNHLHQCRGQEWRRFGRDLRLDGKKWNAFKLSGSQRLWPVGIRRPIFDQDFPA